MEKKDNILDCYTKLNESFDRRLVFHIGDNAGFFSEYNAMIIAMIYCLREGIKFEMYSMDANFKYKEGWNDYFLPFCVEQSSIFHSWFNNRPFIGIGSFFEILSKFDLWKLKYLFRNFAGRFYRKYSKCDFFTPEIWDSLFLREMRTDFYNFPQLNVCGDFSDMCHELVEMTWNYNSHTINEIKAVMKQIDLPDNYVSCHIRGGDKYLENELLSPLVYVNKIRELNCGNKVFVLTDDFTIIAYLRENFLDFEWYTLCLENEKGYINTDFYKENTLFRCNKLIRLFTSIEIINKSNLFIGTKTSNPDIFVKMRTPEKTIFVDTDEDALITSFMILDKDI